MDGRPKDGDQAQPEELQGSLPREKVLWSATARGNTEPMHDSDFLCDPDPQQLAAAEKGRAAARRSAERQSSSNLLALPRAIFSKHS